MKRTIFISGLVLLLSCTVSSATTFAATAKPKCVTAPCNVPPAAVQPTAPTLRFAKTYPLNCVTIPCPEPVSLSWTANALEEQISRYELYRNGELRTTISPSSALTFNDTAYGSKVTYTYMVRAIGQAGAADSNTISYTTKPIPDNQAPTTPTNLKAVYVEAAGKWGARLTWNASTDNIGIDHYIITKGDNITREVTDITVPGGQTSYNDLLFNLYSGGAVNVEYFVSAVDAAGNTSSYSNLALFPPGTTLSANPITIGDRYGARLSWTPVPDTEPVSYYVITRGDSTGETTNFTIAGDLNRYDDLMFRVNTGVDITFFYTISAYDEYGNFMYTSNPVTFNNNQQSSIIKEKLSRKPYLSR